MEKIKLGKSGLLMPPIALGCMRLAGAERTQADKFLHTALELELNFFDHADIYGGGACERVFGEMIKRSPRRSYHSVEMRHCARQNVRFFKGTHFVCRRRQLKAPWHGLS